MNMIGNQFFMCVTWGINSLISLSLSWFPTDMIVDIAQLTPQNLDLVLNIVRLVNSIVAYVQPILLQTDPQILARVLNELLRLSHYLILFWTNCQNALDSGQLSIGDYEAVEVYHGIVLNAINALQRLITSIQHTLGS